jgi:hypothetical protein
VRPVVLGEDVVVPQGRVVAGALEVPAHQGAHARVVERPLVAGEHPRVCDLVVDHRVGVRPVNPRGREEPPKRFDRRRQLAVACHRERRADQREGTDPVGVVEREQLRDRRPGRHPHDMCGRDAQRVQHTGSIRNEVAARVTGSARLVRDRPTGVTVVVADHEPPARGEPPAELLVPPEHRGSRSHDQQHRRRARLAERLRAQPDAVRLDHPLCHDAPPLIAHAWFPQIVENFSMCCFPVGIGVVGDQWASVPMHRAGGVRL